MASSFFFFSLKRTFWQGMFRWCYHPIQRHVTGPPWSSELETPKCGLNSCLIWAFLESILITPLFTSIYQWRHQFPLKLCVQVLAVIFQPQREMSEGKSYPQTPRGLFRIQEWGTNRETPGRGESLIPTRRPPASPGAVVRYSWWSCLKAWDKVQVSWGFPGKVWYVLLWLFL